MPIDQAVLDHRVVGGVAAERGRAAADRRVVVAARRDMIAASLEPLRDAGLEPVGVDLSAFGMIRALGETHRRRPSRGRADQPTAAVLYCNVGDVTNLAVAKGRSCLFTRVSPVGLDDIVASLAATHRPDAASTRGMWLAHVGLGAAARGRSRATRRSLGRGARGARERRRRAARRAAPLARLLRRPGGRGRRSSGSSSAAPAARSPASPSGWSRRSACRSRPRRPRPSPASTPAAAARLTLPYGLALDELAMRPVNLIPEDERRAPASRCAAARSPTSSSAPSSPPCSGSRRWSSTSNQISDRKAEIAQLEARRRGGRSAGRRSSPPTPSSTASANSASPPSTSLADSRFDWERVMRELALVLPGDVWLTDLTATANPAGHGRRRRRRRAALLGPRPRPGAGRLRRRPGIAVAGFVQALKEIDGVTRVGVQSSELGERERRSADSSGSGRRRANCQTRDFIAQFQIVVAFDAAPVASATARPPRSRRHHAE